MGEVTEMVLEGVLCESCGCFIDDDEADGYPRKCEDCKAEEQDGGDDA